MRHLAQGRSRRRGQSMAEYTLITASLLTFLTVGWPFLVALIGGLASYFESLYYVIQSPIP